MKTVIEVNGVSCGACVSDINSKLLKVNGVYGLFANIATQTLEIDHTEDTDIEEVKRILKENNY